MLEPHSAALGGALACPPVFQEHMSKEQKYLLAKERKKIRRYDDNCADSATAADRGAFPACSSTV